MDSRTFQEAIRSATVTYPIPFIFSILLLVTVLSAGGVLLSTGWRSVFLAVPSGFCALAAVVLADCAFALSRSCCGQSSAGKMRKFSHYYRKSRSIG